MEMFIGFAAVGIAAALILMKKTGRLLTVAAFIGGLPLMGVTADYVTWALDTAESWTGYGLSIAVAAGATVWCFYQLREAGTSAITPWIALVLPVLWTVAGGPFLGLADAALGALEGAGNLAEEAQARY